MANNAVTLSGFLDISSIETAKMRGAVSHLICAWLYTDTERTVVPALGGRHQVTIYSRAKQQTDTLICSPIIHIRDWQKDHPRKKPFVLLNGKLRSGANQVSISVDQFVLIGPASPQNVVNQVTLQGHFRVQSVDVVPMADSRPHLRVILTVYTDSVEMGGEHVVLLSDEAANKAISFAKAWSAIDRIGNLPEVKVDGHLMSRDNGHGRSIVTVDRADDAIFFGIPREVLSDNSPTGEMQVRPDGKPTLLGRPLKAGDQVDLEVMHDLWLPGTISCVARDLLLLTENGTQIPLRAGLRLRWPMCAQSVGNTRSILMPQSMQGQPTLVAAA